VITCCDTKVNWVSCLWLVGNNLAENRKLKNGKTCFAVSLARVTGTEV